MSSQSTSGVTTSVLFLITALCVSALMTGSHAQSDDFWDDDSSVDSDYIGREWEASEDLAQSNMDLQNAQRYEAEAQEEAAKALALDSDMPLPDALAQDLANDLSDCEFATRCTSLDGSDVADPNNCTAVACYCGMCVDTGVDTELSQDCVLVDDSFCMDDDLDMNDQDWQDQAINNELSSTAQWLISLTVFAVCSTAVYYLLTQYLQLDATDQERKPLRVQRDTSSNPNPGPNPEDGRMKASYVNDVPHNGYGGAPAYGEAPEIEVVDTTYASRAEVPL